VTTPQGFKAAYRQYVEGGWAGLPAPVERGGQGMPIVIGTAVEEICGRLPIFAFKLCPMLTQGAVEALEQFGTAGRRAQYLAKMVSGEWTGTMNLTEPQAGSDLAAIRTRAVPAADHYRLFGQKIFITYGEHDLTPNIIHMVLARIDGAPPGVKGIRCSSYPRRLVYADGSLGARNAPAVPVHRAQARHPRQSDLPVSVGYGQRGEGAAGYLVGEPGRGLEYMFAMMNGRRGSRWVWRATRTAEAARFNRRRTGRGARRAGQRPPASRRSSAQSPAQSPHPRRRSSITRTSKRMLLGMARADRGLASRSRSRRPPRPRSRRRAPPTPRCALPRTRAATCSIPVVKGCSTEAGIDIASTGARRSHGGMGFIEETGAAQPYRDVRITTIYEGTTEHPVQ
jgi:alkylation response protein AidB-like acyl-CoA dehydrogenase